MTDQVAIELRVVDSKLAKKKDGAGGPEVKRKTVEGKLNAAPHMAKNLWNTFFILSCAFAVFNDPIFCYINAIDNKNKCMTTDIHLGNVYIITRTTLDVVYFIDVLISRCGFCKVQPSCKARIRNIVSTLSRIFVSLPIAQILVETIFGIKERPRSVSFWIILTPIQYILRIYYIYGSLKRRPIIDITRVEKWLKPILDFAPFILTSHLYGAFWYLLATRRQIACWVDTRHKVFPPDVYIYVYSDAYFAECLDPRDRTYSDRGNVSYWDEFCPVKQADPRQYDFGIYFYALQSEVTSPTHGLFRRMLQSLWWALRNLSSFGSNLNSSMDPVEICFCVMISISGMALFLVYLNARVQELKKRTREDILEEKKKLMTPDIDLWLSKQDINKKMKASTKKKEEIKSVILKNIHKFEEHNDLDVQNILSILPIKDKINIISFLFLTSLEKVPMLQNMNEKVLKAICHHLVPVTYTEGSHIIQEGNPFGKFLLITQGVAVTYSNSGSSSNEWLNKGDFYGEELLSWAFNPSYMNLPISTRNVIAQEKVEAFAIRANDLKSVFVRFWWVFSKEADASQLDQYEHLATSSLLAIRHRGTHLTTYKKRTWRHWYGRTTTGPVRWDRFELS